MLLYSKRHLVKRRSLFWVLRITDDRRVYAAHMYFLCTWKGLLTNSSSILPKFSLHLWTKLVRRSYDFASLAVFIKYFVNSLSAHPLPYSYCVTLPFNSFVSTLRIIISKKRKICVFSRTSKYQPNSPPIWGSLTSERVFWNLTK